MASLQVLLKRLKLLNSRPGCHCHRDAGMPGSTMAQLLQSHLQVWLLLGMLGLAGTVNAAVLSIGHRGNALFAPENTVASFTAARGKADLMELDAQLTSDGQFVVMHDSTVDRTTDGTGQIATQTLASLKQVDAGSWFAPQFTGERIPTLAEALQTIIPFATPLIEQKAGGAANYVAELRRLNAVTNVIVQSFDWNFLAAVHALEPNLRLGALGSGKLTASSLTSIRNAGASLVAWEKSGISSNELALVHGAGFPLYVWTVDGPEIQTFLDLGVDGIISNDPGLVKTLQQPATNSPASLGDRLVSYWRMDDGLTNMAVTKVADSKGTNTGNLVIKDGQAHWQSPAVAKFGGCLRVDGTNAAVDIPNSATLDINTNGLTLSAWVKLRDLPSASPEAYGGIYDSVQDCYALYLDRANQELRFKVTVANGNAARPGIPQALLQTNQWLHLAATFNGAAGPFSGQATIYLNGVARDVHTGSDSGSTLGLTGNIKPGQVAAIGRNGTQAVNPFFGLVDDLALWSRALTPSEVRHLFESGQQGLSLGDLLRQPTPLLRVISTQRSTAGNQLQILFQNEGTWQNFRLSRADNWSGPFLAVPDLQPITLGKGAYRFDCPLGGKASEYFRIEGQ